MLNKSFIPYLILLLNISISIITADCRIDPLRIDKSPLIINENNEIIYSNSRTHNFFLEKNDKISITCPNSELIISNGEYSLGDLITVTCIEDDQFEYLNNSLNFYSLSCRDTPQNVVRYTGKSCPEGGNEIEIGYPLSNGIFLRQIKICFDTALFSPIYSHFNLTANINHRNSAVKRINFEENGFYVTSTNLDSLYNRNTERRTINLQLGLDATSETFIKSSGERFINRGHLTAKGDFVYDFEQLATFHYVNSAQQWASFNGGNWNEVEISVRNLANSIFTDLEIYTGVHDISTLRDANGIRTELFLHYVNNKRLLPVPKFFWKLIYDRKNSRGVVIIGINNAYEIDTNEDLICEDISDNLSWFNGRLRMQRQNIELGYIYACSVANFCSQVTFCPSTINVINGILR